MNSPDATRTLRDALDYVTLARDRYRCRICDSPHELLTHSRVSRPTSKRDLVTICDQCWTVFTLGGRISGLYVEESEGVVG